MKIVMVAKEVFDDRFGRLVKGQVVDVKDSKARFFIDRGEAEPYQVKIMRDVPCVGAGENASASLVAPASPQTMLNSSGSGKKRGRPRKVSS